MEKAKLISIVSMGHSGSTLLDMICGTIPGVVSSGEMVYIPWKLYKNKHEGKYDHSVCSCGKILKECNFWEPVITNISNQVGYNIFEYPEKFDISINRSFRYGDSFYYKNYNRVLSYSESLRLTGTMLKLLYNFHRPSIIKNWQLFDKTIQITKKKYFVDSTKDMIRYLFLKNHRAENVKLIILIRDVYGVASSSYHGLTENMIKSRAKAWLRFYNLKVFNVIKKMAKKDYLIIKYEDLCQDPNKERQRINKFIGEGLLHDTVNEINPADMHIVSGNPIRLKGKLTINYDERWKERLTIQQIAALTKIQKKLHPIFIQGD